jgi:CheY-like chemotaxis protein
MSAQALIIEDNHLNRDVLLVLLRHEGLTCTPLETAVGLESTLEGLSTLDVIFLDLELPDVSGFAALEVLKKHPLSQDVPVVAYTVHVSQANQAREAGFHSFLGKPLDLATFPGYLRQILNRQPVWEF